MMDLRQSLIQKTIAERTKKRKSGSAKAVPESKVQKELLNELNTLGIFHKPLVTGAVGFPDLVGVLTCHTHEGRTIGVACYVEVKREGGRVSPAQLYWLSKLASAGAITALCQGDTGATLYSIRLQLQQRGFARVGQCELGRGVV